MQTVHITQGRVTHILRSVVWQGSQRFFSTKSKGQFIALSGNQKFNFGNVSPRIVANLFSEKKIECSLIQGRSCRAALHIQSQNTKYFSKRWEILEPIAPYLKLMRISNPIGTWLLLWPCYWSIALATAGNSLPDYKLLALFGVGAFVMRGAGCTVNDLVDRNLDKKVERTQNRPLANGEISTFRAVTFLGAQLSVGLGVLLCLNNYSIILGASSLLLVGMYPFMKRITHWPQFVLGLTFNWGTLLGYSAVVGYCDWAIVLPLYVAGVSWTLVYDTIYAHQDKHDDILIGIKSTALHFGEKTKSWLTFFSSTTIGGLVLSGIMASQSWPYFACVALGSVHLAWQIKSVNLDDKADCMAKFVSNKWFGGVIFAGTLLGKFC